MPRESAGDCNRLRMSARRIAIDLTQARWHLRAEDWQPVNPYMSTFGSAATETRKSPLTIELDGLKPWPAIPELQYASGIGTYATEFDLPAEEAKKDGAILSLGEVFDSFTLTINGKRVPIDQLSATAEVGAVLGGWPEHSCGASCNHPQ